MKKIIIMSALTSGVLFASVNTFSSAIVDCANGNKGFEIIINNEKSRFGVKHNSCQEVEGEKIFVLIDAEGETSTDSNEGTDQPEQAGDTVNINGEDIYFSNGYTTPTVAADNTCEGGFTNEDIAQVQHCHFQNIPEISEGYLHLTTADNLYLHGNQISDLSPLSNLVNVNRLSLYQNQITDISSLGNLSSVTFLDLSENQIENVDPLSNLSSYYLLNLRSNNIADISGLRNITSVNTLLLNDNQITDISSLSNLELTSRLELHNNQITDLSPLNNTEAYRYLVLDNKEYDVKLDASSYICQNFESINILDENDEPNIPYSNICN